QGRSVNSPTLCIAFCAVLNYCLFLVGEPRSWMRKQVSTTWCGVADGEREALRGGAYCSLLRHILEKVSGSRQDSGRSRGARNSFEVLAKCCGK
ncbi:hypothetical protein ALC56_03851, partial [Trachymyrmex septentrionalis]